MLIGASFWVNTYGVGLTEQDCQNICVDDGDVCPIPDTDDDTPRPTGGSNASSTSSTSFASSNPAIGLVNYRPGQPGIQNHWGGGWAIRPTPAACTVSCSGDCDMSQFGTPATSFPNGSGYPFISGGATCIPDACGTSAGTYVLITLAVVSVGGIAAGVGLGFTQQIGPFAALFAASKGGSSAGGESIYAGGQQPDVVTTPTEMTAQTSQPSG